MNKHLRGIVTALALIGVLGIAACGGGAQFRIDAITDFRTEWTQDVGSGCDKADAAYDAHIMSCRVKPKSKACTAANISEANKVNAEAVRFCSALPESTKENVDKIDGLVAKQLAVGRPK